MGGLEQVELIGPVMYIKNPLSKELKDALLRGSDLSLIQLDCIADELLGSIAADEPIIVERGSDEYS